MPWDNDVPFFLGDFVTADGKPHPACPRQVLKRVLKRAEKMGYAAMIGATRMVCAMIIAVGVKSSPNVPNTPERDRRR